jgi:hypothetical protein
VKAKSERLVQVYRDNAMKKTAVYKLAKHFSEGREIVTDKERSGQPATSRTPSLHLAICFLVYLSVLLFPNSYIRLFWDFSFLPLSAHAQTDIIYVTLLSLL